VIPSGTLRPTTASWQANPVETELAPPLGNFLGAYRFGGEIRIVAPLLGQRPMHLGRAKPELTR